MSNEIKIFENEEFGSVRTMEINGKPYFVGKDVTDILGYQNGSRDINRHVDEHDKRKREYAKSHGYKLLEIWYYDYNNIEEILNRELEVG